MRVVQGVAEMTKSNITVRVRNGCWVVEQMLRDKPLPGTRNQHSYYAVHETGIKIDLSARGWTPGTELPHSWLILPIEEARGWHALEAMLVLDEGMPRGWSLESRVVVTPVRPVLQAIARYSPKVLQNLPRTETTKKTHYIAHHERGFSLNLTVLGWVPGMDISRSWLEYQLPPRRMAICAKAVRRNLQLVARGGA